MWPFSCLRFALCERYPETVILVIDNYDSFTYNLVQYLGRCGAEVDVRRNDKVTLDEVKRLQIDGILLSPGPCRPEQSGVCLDILRWATESSGPIAPIFAVCLGHEAIGSVSGTGVIQAKQIMHGKTSQVTHDGKGLLAGMPNPFKAIRYHSLVVDRAHPPQGFIVSAVSEDDEIMGLRHESRSIEGVQFHPESILTEDGLRIVQNFVNQTKRVDQTRGVNQTRGPVTASV